MTRIPIFNITTRPVLPEERQQQLAELLEATCLFPDPAFLKTLDPHELCGEERRFNMEGFRELEQRSGTVDLWTRLQQNLPAQYTIPDIPFLRRQLEID
ncbi:MULTISPECIES: hypothetical protein [Paenibacillus]|uniref:hypothetical protein n=1 Tax=Paenibacillus TaxID=44249 RepID=UPI0003765691|nr:hypothetical protein [Paenibacillus massiliensis]